MVLDMHVPDFMTHVGQELRLTPVRKFSGLSRSGVLLDTLAQIVNHLIDLGLQRVHLAAGFDSDESREVSIHSSC